MADKYKGKFTQMFQPKMTSYGLPKQNSNVSPSLASGISTIANKIRGSKVNQSIADIGSGIAQVASRAPEAVANLLKIGAQSGTIAFGEQYKPKSSLTKGLVKFSDDVIKMSKNQQKLIDEVTKNKTLSAVSQGGTSILMSAGIGLLAGTGAAAGTLAAYESLPEYTNALKAGVSKKKALLTAAASGAGTYITEKIGLDFMFKNLGGKFVSNSIGNQIARRVTTGMIGGASEAVQETIQNAWQNLVKNKSYDETQKIFENWSQTAIISFGLGAITGGFGANVSNRQIKLDNVNKEIEKYENASGIEEKAIKSIQNELVYSRQEATNLFNSLGEYSGNLKGKMEESMLSLGKDTNKDSGVKLPLEYNTEERNILASGLPSGIRSAMLNEIKTSNQIDDGEFVPSGLEFDENSKGAYEDVLKETSGWASDEQKVKFDTALNNGDKETVTSMLGEVPQDYKSSMSDKIAEVVGESQFTLNTPAVMKESEYARKLRARLVEKGLIEAGLSELPEIETKTLRGQSEAVADLIGTDINAVKRMLKGTQEIPAGIVEEALIKGAEIEVEKTGDIDLANILISMRPSQKISLTGQALGMARIGSGDGYIDALRSIKDAKKRGIVSQEKEQKSKDTINEANKKVTKRKKTLKEKLKNSEDNWSSFQSDVEQLLNDNTCKI